jgi:hypothetical protein
MFTNPSNSPTPPRPCSTCRCRPSMPWPARPSGRRAGGGAEHDDREEFDGKRDGRQPPDEPGERPESGDGHAVGALQPGVQDAQAYGEQLRQIVADIQKDFQQAADTHLVEAKNTLSALIYDVTQNVKPGQENAVEIIKAAIDNAFKGYEQVTQSTRDAMRRVEEQVTRATSQLAAAAGQAPRAN